MGRRRVSTNPKNLFWDTCCFIRYITKVPPDGWSDLDDYISDAKKGTRKIYYSTIVLAEIRPRYLKSSSYGAIQEFFADFQGAFYPIEPNPNILIDAAKLRDAIPINPPGWEGDRETGTADSIHLSTCIYARDVLGIEDIVFHTYDDGKKKGWEGKTTSLLRFDQFFPNATGFVASACSLIRTKPIYPQLRLQGTE